MPILAFLGMTTSSPTVMGSYSDAINVLPTLFLSESIASIVITRTFVPSGTTTFLGCGGGGGAGAGGGTLAAAGGAAAAGAAAGARAAGAVLYSFGAGWAVPGSSG